ncbi:MAG TPA: hypothetical protein VFO18_18265, partial [Methylomirabilota bacterium]|nr:hypothetical protein [Methylomirabilota bacterium]
MTRMKATAASTAMLLLCVAAPLAAHAASFSSEAAWQAAAGAFSLENFDAIGIGTQLSSLPGLGISFGLLNDGVSFPSVQTNASGFGGVNHS